MSDGSRIKLLSPLIRRIPVESIEDVLLVMDTIDTQLTNEDGLWWFNLLYRMVTREILEDCRREAWRSPAWLIRLDVEFAKLYFDAICLWEESPDQTPNAWRALFERRSSSHIAPLQYGMAGMNAHINRDLPLAVVRACEQCGCSPRAGTAEQDDYIRVNKILDEVEIRAMQRMATGWIKRVSDTINPVDRKVAISVVARARAQAWVHAERYWAYGQAGQQKRQQTLIRRLDGIAYKIGQALLLPTFTQSSPPSLLTLARRWREKYTGVSDKR